MDDDKPTIAIIGAGPIGIETALYGRYLGHTVRLYEQGKICDNIRQWGHVQLFTPFGMNTSPLGLSALSAQYPDRTWPSPEQLHTGDQWIDQYLEPLANSDLIRGCIVTETRVQEIARDTPAVDEETPRSEVPFRLLLSDISNGQRTETADIVIDASGTFSHANPVGIGGMSAVGEKSLHSQCLPDKTLFTQRIPDLENFMPANDSTFLVIGRGFSAATSIVQLEKLHQRDPSIRCTWITRISAHPATDDKGPIGVVENDPLDSRRQLARTANKIATDSDWLEWKPGIEIAAIQFNDGRFHVTLSNDQQLAVDHVIANTGFRGDYEMLQALQIHRCYASGGPMAWAASILDSSMDCMQQSSSGPDALRTTEHDFYIVGSKSYGKDPRFLYSTGLQQIRDVYRIIAERHTLDLYGSLQPDKLIG